MPRLYVFSGAGLSAESGVSTFRAKGGIWERFDVDVVGSYKSWRQHRAAIFDFHNETRREIDAASPNAAHRQIARWQATWGTDRVRLITQNVDDLLERAGAADVVHLHGDLASLLCTDCNHRFTDGSKSLNAAARCPLCGNIECVKPGIVLFGEQAPLYSKLNEMQWEMRAEDILVVVGTAFAVVTPDRLLPYNRQDNYPRNVLVDPDPQWAEFFGLVLNEPATLGLERIDACVTALMEGATDADARALCSAPTAPLEGLAKRA
jgi:NAD-dependent deacetylase